MEMRVGVVRINYANEGVKVGFPARKKSRRPYVNEGEELSRLKKIGGGAWFGNVCERGRCISLSEHSVPRRELVGVLFLLTHLGLELLTALTSEK